MSTTPASIASISSIDTQTTKEKAKAKKRAKPGPKPAAERPSKYLPTERITFAKQLDILRAWAAASGPAGKVVTNDDVAEIVKMQPSTVSLANPFLASGGLIVKTDGGYVPCAEVMTFLRAYEWSPETAATKLAPVLEKTWFAEELLPKLAFGPMTEDDALQKLAEAASAAPDRRDQLEILLSYLASSGLIQRDGTQIKKGGTTAVTARADSPPPQKLESSPVTQEPSRRVPSLFGTTEGAVNFNVSVRVEMTEFATWKPERIAAFFNGMAQVLAAKADVEKGE